MPAPGGDLSKAKTVLGKKFTEMKKGVQPAYGSVPPSPRQQMAPGMEELPLALQGRAHAPQMQQGGLGYANYRAMQANQSMAHTGPRNVDEHTEEKTRGESYIRLLTKISSRVNDGKVIKPYRGDLIEPPAKLLIKTKYNLDRPVPLGEEDEFEEMDRSYTVLFSFVRHNRYEAVESMVQQDLELLKVADDAQNSLLHIACQNNHRRIAKLLLKFRADVDKKNGRGNTALHYCYAYGYGQLAEFLVSVGADETVVNSAGLMPSEGLGEEKQEKGVAKQILQTRMA
jgi:hypothetical protein